MRFAPLSKRSHSVPTLALLLAGCFTSPAPKDAVEQFGSNYEEFVEERGAPIEMEVSETSECASAVDSSNGSYLVTIRTNLAFEDNPIFYKVDLELLTDDGGAMTSNWNWSPLDAKGDNFSFPVTLGPEEVMSEGVLEFLDVAIESNGAFVLDFGRVIIPSIANSITGRPIDAELFLAGELRPETGFCGVLSGEVFAPIMWDLSGSSLGSMPFQDMENEFSKDNLSYDCAPCGETPPNPESMGEQSGGANAAQADEETGGTTTVGGVTPTGGESSSARGGDESPASPGGFESGDAMSAGTESEGGTSSAGGSQ